MPPAKVIILEYVCPGMGIVMANIMFSSPANDLRKALQDADLGVLNPTPWAFMLGNCLGWVTYGILKQNLWIFFGNCPGFVLSIWLNLGAVKLLYQKHHSDEMTKKLVDYLAKKDDDRSEEHVKAEREGEREGDIEEKISSASSLREISASKRWTQTIVEVTSQRAPAPILHENLVMIISIIWVICIAIIGLEPSLEHSTREQIVAYLVNLNLVFFYGGPLSTIYSVLRERNTSSIHILTMITNTLNAIFWTAYGFAIQDYFIAIPNGIGAIFGGIQIFLCMTFPRKLRSNSELQVQ